MAQKIIDRFLKEIQKICSEIWINMHKIRNVYTFLGQLNLNFIFSQNICEACTVITFWNKFILWIIMILPDVYLFSFFVSFTELLFQNITCLYHSETVLYNLFLGDSSYLYIMDHWPLPYSIAGELSIWQLIDWLIN